MGGVELIERPRLARGVTQHQLRVGVAHSHRRHSTRTVGRGSELNAPQSQFVFVFARKRDGRLPNILALSQILEIFCQ